MNRIFLLLGFSLFGAYYLHAQCDPGQLNVRVEIDADEYFYEVSFVLTNTLGDTLAKGFPITSELTIFNFCVPADGGCTDFLIRDTYGDGMAPDGLYRVYVDDILVRENIGGNYGLFERTRFNCPQGSYCTNPFVIDSLGQFQTPSGDETWYAFVPSENGTYQLSTCDTANQCPSKIWVYNRCQGITLSDNQTGAIFYADKGCDNGAVASIFLAGGVTYYIRLAYADSTCSATSLRFSLQYTGPIVGCMDSTSCNFNPLATVPDTCYYHGDENCTNVPDLIVLEEPLRSSVALDYIENADDCMVAEGCLRGVGQRYIVRFSTHIQNIGNTDYFIGLTPDDPQQPSDQFIWDPCHNHWHYSGYADYLLYDTLGNRIPIGTKNGFCVLDLECEGGGFGKYNCTNMGISAACGDIYDASLPCQWIDITNLPAGVYALVVRVNWDKSPDKLGRFEKTYDNNWAKVCFSLSYNDSIPEIEVLDSDCPDLVDCNGVTLGGATKDCEGVCEGTAVQGDINTDFQRNMWDVQGYLEVSLSDDVPVTNCTDLFADGLYDLYDAALLQECVLHSQDVSYWGVRFPCQFPTGFIHENDWVVLSAGTLDTVARTFEIKITNPFSEVIGYEFAVSGLTIDSLVNLDSHFDGLILQDGAGEILSLSTTETGINKHLSPSGLLKIHYGKLTSDTVCIETITAIVNQNYQRSHAVVGNPACRMAKSVAVHSVDYTTTVFVRPNPFDSAVEVHFDNPGAETLQVALSDLTGRLIRQYSEVSDQKIIIERGGLASGLYLLTVRGQKGVWSGKIIAR
jgi:hypothetical protein